MPKQQKRAKGDGAEVIIREMPIAAPKKRAKKAPISEKEDNAKDLMCALKKASKQTPLPNKYRTVLLGR